MNCVKRNAVVVVGAESEEKQSTRQDYISKQLKIVDPAELCHSKQLELLVDIDFELTK